VKVTVRITKSFSAAIKPLLKKYHSLSKDLLDLEKELITTPKLGTPLGQNAYKIRLKISSKGKGKSGGARVISLVETIEIISEEEITVNLVTIYDKADVEYLRQRTERANQKCESKINCLIQKMR
jgi:mRNA-degrading endonuclease RelE of RelBE toxin-antitoxin system